MKTNSFGVRAVCLAALCLLVTTESGAAPPRYHVRAGGTGDGSTWAMAGGDLQAGIEAMAASGGGQVWVAEGTYKPSSRPNGGSTIRENHFSLRNGVTVLGGFPSEGDPDLDMRDPAIHPTVCSGDIQLVPEPSDNTFHVFYHPSGASLGPTAVLDGFVITSGNANGDGTLGYGGGMFNQDCAPTLVRCVFLSNASRLAGGGLWLSGADSIFDHCFFRSNSSAGPGGALAGDKSKPSFGGCVFSGNSATEGGAARFQNESITTLRSCTFSGNTASVSGGALSDTEGSAVTVWNTIFWGDSGGEVVDGSHSASTLWFCQIAGGWGGAGGSNKTNDPLFVASGSPAGEDGFWGTNDDGLRLQPGSPCQDHGNADELPADTGDLDRDGITAEPTPFDGRMLGRFVPADLDRGAYEGQRPTVTFNLAGHATRTGGGELVQVLDEGTSATAPTLAVDFGWSFTGWDQGFADVFTNRTVTAQYTALFTAGSICYVREGGTGDGTSWDQSTGRFQAAIEAMAGFGGGSVWVAAGTFRPDSWPNGGSAAREVHFSLRNNVSVLGGFPATGSPVLAQRNPAVFRTVCSGDIGTMGSSIDNSFHVFYHPAGAALDGTARLDGVVISDGFGDDIGAGIIGRGGGMYNLSCSPTLLRCLFVNNQGWRAGGGLYLEQSNARVANCVFAQNSTVTHGGGACVSGGNVSFVNCLFSQNIGGGGGAVSAEHAVMAFCDCTMAGNTGSWWGGAIDLFASTAVVSNSILWNNSLDQITVQSGSATLNSCIIQDGWTGAGNNNLSTDPLFADAADPDGPDNLWATDDDGLRPSTVGPASNSGNASLLPADAADLDADGNTAEALPRDLAMRLRVRDSGLDRGAYEPITPQIYHVRVGGTGAGLTWANSMGDLQQAIETAFIAGSSQVWVAEGIYKPTSWPNGGGGEQEKHFSLRNGVSVFGGFPATGDPGLAQRNPALQATILSGDVGTPGYPNDNTRHVFFHPASAALDSTARLDGVVVRDGYAGGTDLSNAGGGMLNQASSPTLVRCRIENNYGLTAGGGLLVSNAGTLLVACVIAGNSSGQWGGGIAADTGAITLVDCLVTGNSSLGGAGLFLDNGAAVEMRNSTIAANGPFGGGVFIQIFGGGSLVASNSILWGNASFQVGGNVSAATLNSCIIQAGWPGPGTNNLSTNPAFLNASDPDGADNLWGTDDDGLHPTTAGSAFDSGNIGLLPSDVADLDADGITTEALPRDLAMRQRVRDAGLDRGAYEALPPQIYHVRLYSHGDGLSWANALDDPQAAIEAASVAGNSQVWIAAGIYKPNSWPNGGSTEREKHFSLRAGVPVYGGFPAGGAPVWTDRDPILCPTVLSGDLGAIGNTSDNAYHVIYQPGVPMDGTARLDGVTVTGGNANGTGPHQFGGGMFVNDGSPVLARCVFRNNNATRQAGGLYLGGSSSVVANCVFSSNSSHEGGGVFLYQGAPSFANCLFCGNNSTYVGGGIASYTEGSGPAVFDQCTVAGNTASNAGGGCSNNGTYLVFNNSILWGNAPDQMLVTSGSSTLNSCLVQGGWSGPGSGNQNLDPLFTGPTDPDGADNRWRTADDGLQPSASSPALNNGNPALIPLDTADLDGDGNVGEAVPVDLNGQPRVRGLTADRGAYETRALIVFHVRVGGSGNGMTWATSLGDPQAAIEAAVIETNSQVWVAAGTFYPVSWPNGGADVSEKHFALRNGVTVLGGFPAAGDPGLANRDPTAYQTVFSGDLGTVGSASDNAFHVFNHPGTGLDSTARLDGAVISGGNASGSTSQRYGGGIYNYNDSPTISRCCFQGNMAMASGGGLFLRRSTSMVVACVFTGNSALLGGGLDIYDESPTVADCVFWANNATEGAAIRLDGKGVSHLVNCTVAGNTAGSGSGAVHNTSKPTIDNCLLSDNTPAQILAGDAILRNCLVRGGYGGAGSGNFDADPGFTNLADPDGPDNRWRTSDDGLHVPWPSLAVNAGDPSFLPADTADLDGDGDRTESLPQDAAGLARSIDGRPDCGAYESEFPGWSLAYWRSIYFSVADRLDPAKQATLWGDQADPDGDGLPNSGEYLLAANPLRSDNPMATLPVIRKWGVSWLQWVVTQTKDRPGVTLDTWYSPDLQAGSWEETAWLGFPYRVLDESYTARTWEILVPVWDPQGFVRMSFTSP